MAGPAVQVFPAAPSTGRNQTVLSAPWLFTGEDNLRVVVINSQSGVVVTVDGRFMETSAPTKPSPINETITPTANRVPTTKDIALGTGYLLNLSVVVTSGSPLVGQTYVMVQVIRGLSGATMVLGCLLGGYVTAMQHLAYPGSPIESSTAGEPFVRTVVGTIPALGVDLSETVPTGARWELLRGYAEFVASGAGITRLVTFQIRSGGALTSSNISAGTIAPGVKRRWTWAPNLPFASSATDEQFNQPIPQPTLMIAGDLFRTSTINMEGGDRWDSLVYNVREWLEVA